MSALIKLQIQQKLTTILNEITVANGFNTENKGTWRGRSQFGQETDIPFLALMESPRSDIADWATEDNTVSKDAWTLLIQGFVSANGQEHPTDAAYIFLHDVETQLGKITATRSNGFSGGQYPEYFMLNGMITKLELEPAVVRPGGDDVSPMAYFYQPVRLTLVRDLKC